MLRIGMFLGDRYEILEKIGSGGMSDVYKAKCHKLNRNVAIKVLKSEYSADINFVSKFKMEAQSAAGLSHPNIVNIFDVGDEGEIHYIVMELIEGVTLKDYILKKGQLEIRETVGIAIQVAQGIAAAHEQNIIHRDIKPQNIIISKDGKIKVMDFGIARAASTETIHSNAMGSVHYISPEQARGGYCGERSDIYSLGITIYEMITGRLPYEGDNSVAIAVLHITSEISLPSDYVPDIPNSLEQIIIKCTQKKPERRYATAEELIADLKKFLVTPGGDFVKVISLDDTSPTVIISDEEVSRIKQESKNVPVATRKQTKAKVNSKNKDNLDDEDDEDVNPKIEKILNMVGIGVAALIIILVIFVVGKITNIFPGSKPSVSTENSSSELAADETYMPSLEGLKIDEAEKKLTESSLGRDFKYENSDDIAKDYVVSQSVKADEILKKHTSVEVVISLGPDYINIGALKLMDLSVEAARKLLVDKGLKVEVTEEFSDTVELDKMIRYEAPAEAKKNDTVILYKSKGAERILVKIPNLYGLTEQQAKTALEDAKLKLGNVSKENSSNVDAGKVIKQSHETSQEVDMDTLVDIVISEGPVPEKEYKYYGSIDVIYDLSSYFGPGSGSDVKVIVRLAQTVNGEEVSSVLIPTATVSSNTKISIKNNKIEGANGVESGLVKVMDAESGEVFKEFSIVFMKTEVSN